MSFTHQFQSTWNGGGASLPASANYTDNGETNRSVTVAEGASNIEAAMAFGLADLHAIEIVPTGPVFLETNSSSAPDNTFNITSWLEWRRFSGIANPFTAAVTKFFFTDGWLGNTTAIHAAVTDNGSPVTVTTAIVQPLGGLRKISATAGGTAGDIKAISVTVNGLDEDGAAQSEVLPVFTVNTAGTVNGALYFSRVDSFTIPAHDGTGATTSLGVVAETGMGATTVEVRVLHDGTP